MTTRPLTTWQLETSPHCPPRTVGWLLGGLLAALYALALLLVARRAMGAFTVELPWQALLVTALTAFAVITGLRILWRRAIPERTIADQWIAWGSSLTLVLIAGGLSFPGNQQRDWLIWLPLFVGDWLIRRRLFDSDESLGIALAEPQAGSEHHVQQIVRTRNDAGGETVRATLRADFQAGQRNATVYIGFCPPLAGQPEIAVEPVEGAESKIVQAFPHGARIDVRLAQIAGEAMSLALSVNARTSPSDTADEL
jgi:hypothetical protein